MAMVNISESRKTEVEAVERKEQLLRQWHPAGYGTTLKVRHDVESDQWMIEGYRYASCD